MICICGQDFQYFIYNDETTFFFCRLSVENITEEVKNLKAKLKELEKAMKNGPKDVSEKFNDFMEVELSFFLLVISCQFTEWR